MHIKEKRCPPTIENYLSGVPLNIQSIAYDISLNRVVGNVGIQAIKDKIVRVNDLEMAEKIAEHYGLTLRECLEKKASELAFNYLEPIE